MGHVLKATGEVIVQAQDLVSVVQEPLAEVATQESGTASYQASHKKTFFYVFLYKTYGSPPSLCSVEDDAFKTISYPI